MKIDDDAGDGKFKLERALPVLLIIAIIVISTMILYRLLSGTNESDSNNVAKIHSPVSETEQSIETVPQVVREDKPEQRDSNENTKAIASKENDTEVLTEIETKDERNDQKIEIISGQQEAEEAQRIARQQEAEEAKRIARQKESEEAKRIARQEEAEEAQRIARQEEAEEAKRSARQEEAEIANRIARQQEAEEAKRIARQQEAEEAKRIADQRDLEPKQQLVLKEAAQPEKKERLDSEWVANNWEKAREVEVVALLSEAENQLITKDLSVSILNTAMGKYRSLERITGGDSRVSELYSKILDSHVKLAKQQEKAEQLSDAMTTIDNGLGLNSRHRKLLKIKKKVSKKLTKIENLGQSAPLIGTF